MVSASPGAPACARRGLVFLVPEHLPMARRTVIAAAGGALLLAVGAAWWLMRPAGPESGPREAPVVSLPGRAAVAPPVELPAPVAGVTSAALAAVEEAPARAEGPAPIPESYRRALGGIT